MAILINPGRWGLTLIVQEADGTYNTSAMQARIASQMQAFYPPLNATKTAYSLGTALIYCTGTINNTDPNTFLFPVDIDATEPTLGDLTLGQRTTISGELLGRLTAYEFTDWDSTLVQVSAFSVAGYTLTTTLRQIVLDIFTHLSHSETRPRLLLAEIHNTEYTDNFTTDPSTRWTFEGTFAGVWDSVNQEYDLTVSSGSMARYSANSPGSIEHESQITCVAGTAGTNRTYLCGIRHNDTGTDDCYCLFENADGGLNLARYNADVRTVMTNPTGPGLSTGDFRTFRLAAQGTAGNNVDLAGWYTTHGTSKPSDPGWYGSDGSPNFTYTDTSVDRLDDSVHSQGGVGGRSTTDYDTRHCYFKVRAISDRSGAAPSPPRTNILMLGVG